MDGEESTPVATPTDAPSQQDKGYFNSPFSFLALPVAIRKRILKLELQKPEMVVPYYYTGCVELPDYLVTNSNIDISLLLVNKQLHVEAADTLYGANAFQLSDAKVALWWFRHIGPSNVSRIRSAHFSMDAFWHTNFQVREERYWQMVFSWLESRQRFATVSLSFEWKTAGLQSMRALERSRLEQAREGSIIALCGFRGLDSVEIRGKFLKTDDARELAQIMMLKKAGAEATPSTDDRMEVDDSANAPPPKKSREIKRSAYGSYGRSKSL
ncbi:hypothetical protein MMC07_004647 [Pseudocyphellaria aurata]|nr:hypothetical protein [Pseudocyphellaria aurata]